MPNTDPNPTLSGTNALASHVRLAHPRLTRLQHRLSAILTNRWLTICLVGALILGGRLMCIKSYGVQEPYLDGFSELGDYQPLLRHDFATVWQRSFQLHDEHRIVFTHWLNSLLFLANGSRWDPLGQACANAVLSAIGGMLLVGLFSTGFSPVQRLLFATCVVFVFALPFAFENILWGFQSCFYFFILFSILGIWLLLTKPALSAGWWLGFFCAVAACFSLASGLYVAGSVIVSGFIMLLRREHRSRSTLLTIGAGCLIVILNVPFIHHDSGLDVYKANSIRTFLLAFTRHLAWPAISPYAAWLGPILSLPFLLLLVGAVFTRRVIPKSTFAIISLGVWTMLITLTLSYLRGRYTPYQRYYDCNAFHVIVSAAALVELFRLRLVPDRLDRVFTFLTALWLGIVAAGGMYLLDWTLNVGLPMRKNELQTEQRAVRRFLETRNVEVLRSKELGSIFPFSGDYATFLGSQLSDSATGQILPGEMLPDSPRDVGSGLLSRLRKAILRRADAFLLFSLIIAALHAGFTITKSYLSRLEP